MSKFIFEGRDNSARSAHERIAMQNIRHAINWIVGGHYNDLQDDNLEYLPASRKALADEVYECAMTNRYAPGYEGYGKAPKEMRFSGSAFCRAYINWKLANDPDVDDIATAANWTD